MSANSELSKDPAVVEWVASWRALNDDRLPLRSTKKGWATLSRTPPSSTTLPWATISNPDCGTCTSGHSTTLGCDYHHDVALRVLATHVAKRPKNFEFSLNDKDAYQAGITKRDPSVEAAIRQRVAAEVDLMGPLASYNDAFRFLHRLRSRLEQDYASRAIVWWTARRTRRSTSRSPRSRQ